VSVRNNVILVIGLSVSLAAGIATATEAVQPSAAAAPVQEAAAPVHAPAAANAVAPAAPAAHAAPVAPAAPVAHPAPAATAAPVAAAAPAAAAATVAAAEEDPMVCKKITETGTLGRKRKVCMTAAQWEQQRKNARGIMRGIDSGAGAQGPVGVPSNGG
jgi:hypothetical protein